jgi:hypothetical protein
MGNGCTQLFLKELLTLLLPLQKKGIDFHQNSFLIVCLPRKGRFLSLINLSGFL